MRLAYKWSVGQRRAPASLLVKDPMSESNPLSLLRRRRDDIRDWLDEEAPYTAVDQRHLDSDSTERAYWHHGYQAALTDALELLTNVDRIYGSEDIPN
jgi:hypothetical protein